MKAKKTIIPSCDVATEAELRELVKATADVQGIGAYKIGFELVIPFGMQRIVRIIREFSDLPVIYDHQKAGTDVPFTGRKFVHACKGADAIIIFPQAGPESEKAFIQAAQDAGTDIIVGGEMTHPAYLAADGGYLADDTPQRIYTIAAEMGVRDFVVPGNKPAKIKAYRELLENLGIQPVLYSPGLLAQGGLVEESARAAGQQWHAIVGRGIYGQPDAQSMRKAAEELVKVLQSV